MILFTRNTMLISPTRRQGMNLFRDAELQNILADAF